MELSVKSLKSFYCVKVHDFVIALLASSQQMECHMGLEITEEVEEVYMQRDISLLVNSFFWISCFKTIKGIISSKRFLWNTQ